MHYDLVMNYSDFYSWVWQSLYDPHGPIHIFIGGVVDCEDTYKDIANLVGEYPASQLASLSFFHRKCMYRDGIFKCEGTAEIDEKPYDVSQSAAMLQGLVHQNIWRVKEGAGEVIPNKLCQSKREPEKCTRRNRVQPLHSYRAIQLRSGSYYWGGDVGTSPIHGIVLHWC